MSPLPLVLAQGAVVLVAARAGGWLAGRVGQPAVVGEMAAGLALGPAVFGAVAPGWQAALFPAGSLEPLGLLGTLGVLCFLFVVGARVDHQLLRHDAAAAAWTGIGALVVPIGVGVVLAPGWFARYAGPAADRGLFVATVAIAMGITAFPVLARILVERGVATQRVGRVALAAAALGDVAAWVGLAWLLAATQAGGSDAWGATIRALLRVGGVLLLAAVVAPRLLAWATRGVEARGRVPAAALVAAPLVAWLCLVSWATHAAGVHALVGAFVGGAALPSRHGVLGRAIHRVLDGIEQVAAVALLPLFFAVAGVRTSLGSLAGREAWGLLALVLGAAIVSKVVGGWAGACVAGLASRDALAVGVLMNTRGLMELLVLSVALDAGLIAPTLHAAFALMAWLTTAMTGPWVTQLLRSPAGAPGGALMHNAGPP